MKTQTFETSKGTLLAVRLFDGVDSLHLFNDYATNPNWNSYISYNIGHETHRHYLPPGDWQPLGLLKDITEDQAKEVVDESSLGLYQDYASGVRHWHYTALESLQSLLETGIKLLNPLKQPMALPGFENNEGYLRSKAEWQTTESQVWKNPFLIFKTK